MVCFYITLIIFYALLIRFTSRMGPDININDIDLSSLQISEAETKDESNDSGYSSADTDDETQHKAICDFKSRQVPTFEEEDELNEEDMEVDSKDEDLFENELGGICTFVQINDKVSEILALGPDAKLEGMVW